MLNILFSLEICIAYAFFGSNLTLIMLVVSKIFPKFFKKFQNLPATQEIKL